MRATPAFKATLVERSYQSNRYWRIQGTRLNETVHKPKRVMGILGHVRPRSETYRHPFHMEAGSTGVNPLA